MFLKCKKKYMKFDISIIHGIFLFLDNNHQTYSPPKNSDVDWHRYSVVFVDNMSSGSCVALNELWVNHDGTSIDRVPKGTEIQRVPWVPDTSSILKSHVM